jgi:hypothetical protein
MPAVKITRFSRSKEPVVMPEVDVPDPIPAESAPAEYDSNIDLQEMGNFLDDLTNDKFVPLEDLEKKEKDRLKQEKQWEREQNKITKMTKAQEAAQKKAAKMQKDYEKEANKKSKQRVLDDENALFSEKGSMLYGRDKLELVARIREYKVTFPQNKQLQQLKIKQTATVEELQQYLSAGEAIIDCDCVETFITDSILQAIQFGEYVSVRTRYNIRGLSEMLRKNPQFNLLCKQLYIKYKVFSKVPPEAQMVFVIASSAYVCIEKNKLDDKKQAILNKPIDVSQFN